MNRFCKICTNKLQHYQENFCSCSCARTYRNKNTKPVICPKCNKHLFSRWNKHITTCNPKTCEVCKEIYAKNRFCSPKCCKIYFKKNPRRHTEKFKFNQKKNIEKRYKQGWLPKAGRCKKIIYVSHIAGEVRLDGSWELIVAKYLDKTKCNWRRNITRFKYKNFKGTQSHYTPDFYLIDFDTYIEVKGYETKLDRLKWSQFKYKLEIWRKERINEINMFNTL